jgi:hypothetical protein
MRFESGDLGHLAVFDPQHVEDLRPVDPVTESSLVRSASWAMRRSLPTSEVSVVRSAKNVSGGWGARRFATRPTSVMRVSTSGAGARRDR